MSGLSRLATFAGALMLALLCVMLTFWGLASLATMIIGDSAELDGERAMTVIVVTLVIAAMLIGLVSLGLNRRHRRRHESPAEATDKQENADP